MDKSHYGDRLIQIAAGELPRARNLKKALVDGADINYQSQQNGFTALMYVVSGQYDRIAEYLLYQGANPLLRNDNNQTAKDLVPDHATVLPILQDFELFFAAKNNDLKNAKMLIERGASISFTGPRGYTPLLIAVETNNLLLVEYLLYQGADLSQTTVEGKTVFDLASNTEILKLLKNANLAGMEAAKAFKSSTKNKSNFFTIPTEPPLLNESTV